jgi:threonine dehydratase
VISLDAIESARARIAGAAVRTPLVRLHVDAPAEIWLKLENLQPIASFKIRGAANAVRGADPAEVEAGLVTASAGNMAQGVAWIARELGLPATIVVPEQAPEAKLAAVGRLGGTVLRVPYADWWRAINESRVEGVDGLFVHPVVDERVMAGNGTIALEILEDLPEPGAVVVPYGGGGLVTGIASALRAVRPATRVYAVEPESGAALNAALAAGTPTEIDYQPSFVDGAGSPAVLPDMFARVRELIDGAFTASLEETAAAVRLLAERTRVVAEGAGGLAPAAALAGRAGEGPVVCVVSGGNIDLSTLGPILAGRVPQPPR